MLWLDLYESQDDPGEMRRRDFIKSITGCAIAWPFVALGQDQKSESASGEAGGRGGLGALNLS